MLNTQPQKKTLGVGWALYSAARIWSDVLAAGNTACADARSDSFGVDHSIDRSRCDDCDHFGGANVRWRHQRNETRRGSLGIGVLDTSAYVFNNFGMKLEQISVVSVLASLYGAVTVALAALILKERVSRSCSGWGLLAFSLELF